MTAEPAVPPPVDLNALRGQARWLRNMTYVVSADLMDAAADELVAAREEAARQARRLADTTTALERIKAMASMMRGSHTTCARISQRVDEALAVLAPASEANEQPQVSDRGLLHFEPLDGTYAGSNVRLVESSSAEAEHWWLFVQSEQPKGEAGVHLTVDQLRRLHDQVTTALAPAPPTEPTDGD